METKRDFKLSLFVRKTFRINAKQVVCVESLSHWQYRLKHSWPECCCRSALMRYALIPIVIAEGKLKQFGLCARL
jgi:hypothetical protein